MYLNNIKNNGYYTVDKIKLDEKNKRRLYDIGLVKDTKIKLLFSSPSKKIKAYLIRDSIIAIRNNDASKIEVKKLND
ncbi:MAG: ferrous iron transport protein A [Bacilli bacterium]|nr:ferrous iron transport protein A [Bacilli bacterium]